MAKINIYLVYQCVLRKILALLVEAQIEVSRGQDMGQSSKPMEQHGCELDDQNQGEEEHKHQSNRFQLQILFADMNLNSRKTKDSLNSA